ncbi:MAG: glycosyltransferase [Leptolyngbya sp. SIO1E4]|nr:glycosyltransferase [Leptolyngbya sp. SIO1E4]
MNAYTVSSWKRKAKSLVKRALNRLRNKVNANLTVDNKAVESETYSSAFKDVNVGKFWEILDPVIKDCRDRLQAAEAPQISIITPTFNSSLDWFIETALSVFRQSSNAWEWCIVDDGSTSTHIRDVLAELARKHPRIKVEFQASKGISGATNRAIEVANGTYVCFLDHDDTLSPRAIETSLGQLANGFDFVYSDEDKIDLSGRYYVEPFFKPDWSPEYFRGVMYVGHFLCVRKALLLSVGGFDSHYDGIQDYEFVLRLSETSPRVSHIPEVLYHWRKIEGSIAANAQAKPRIEELQQAAVDAHLKRLGLPSRAESIGNHRLSIVPLEKPHYPLVSVIIPTKDAPQHLERSLESLFTISNYPNLEILLVDNETSDPKALQLMQKYPVKRVFFPNPFNYSRANNLGAQYAQGEYLIFLNNDTEIIGKDWIQHLLYYAEQSDIGAVGSLLLFPNRTVQHAGVVMGFRGTADHVMRGFPSEVDGYAGSLVCAHEVSAVTAACMMVAQKDFSQVEGFNEHYFHHYQDVDLCLKLLKLGKRNIFTPGATLIHHESVTRKDYYDLVDRYLLLDQWQDYIDAGDPYYNPNFVLERCDYTAKAQ